MAAVKSDVLTRINADKREHIAACKAATPLSALEDRAKAAGATLSLIHI